MKSRSWVVASNPSGPVTAANFADVETDLPALRDDDVLIRVGTVGIEPALNFRMRAGGNFPALHPGDPVPSSAVGIVLESRNKRFALGDYVYGSFGWQQHVIAGNGLIYCVNLGNSQSPLSNARGIMGEAVPRPTGPYALNDYLGILGGAGVDAWFGVFDFGRLRLGETALITGAAGGIGSIAAQLAVLAGAHVIGTTRDSAKAGWLTGEVGCSDAIVPQHDSFAHDLRRLAPAGIDLLIDNVGGWQTAAALPALARKARIVVCGLIAGYQGNVSSSIPMEAVVFNDLEILGFFGDHYLSGWSPALDRLGDLLSKGELKPLYDVRYGFGAAPSSYLNLYEGETNRGKMMVQFEEM